MPTFIANMATFRYAHQTYPIVKLTVEFYFTNSYPHEAILGAIDAPWGVLSRLNFRRWLKKLGKKLPRTRVLDVPPFFLGNFIFTAQVELRPSKAAKKSPQTTQVCFHSYSSALATVFQLWTPCIIFFYKIYILSARLVF